MLVKQTDRGFSVPVSESKQVRKNFYGNPGMKFVAWADEQPKPAQKVRKSPQKITDFIDQGLKDTIREALNVLDKYAPKQEQPAQKVRGEDDGWIVNRRGHKSDRDVAMSALLGRSLFGLGG